MFPKFCNPRSPLGVLYITTRVASSIVADADAAGALFVDILLIASVVVATSSRGRGSVAVQRSAFRGGEPDARAPRR